MKLLLNLLLVVVLAVVAVTAAPWAPQGSVSYGHIIRRDSGESYGYSGEKYGGGGRDSYEVYGGGRW